MFAGGDKRNIVIAIGLVAIILVGWQFLFPTADRSPPQQSQNETASNISENDIEVTIQKDGKLTSTVKSFEDAIKDTPRILIDAPRLHGSISLRGARIDDIRLKEYRESVENISPEITIFSPRETKSPHFAEFGWTSSSKISNQLPAPDTLWETNNSRLTPESPVTLKWDNGNGLVFEKIISVDNNFAFTIIQNVSNSSNNTLSLNPYSLLRRFDPFDDSVYYKPWGIFQDGALGRLGEQQLESDYSDMEDGEGFSAQGTSGWVGITSKYFLAALIPDQTRSVRATSKHIYPESLHNNQYQVDLIEIEPLSLAPGEKTSITTHLFAGAKKVSILDMYEEKLGVNSLDLAVDFGFAWFLAKPLFYAVDFFFGLAGNFGVAILLLTICVRIILFPLANKAYASMSRMRKLQPQMLLLRERFGDDKQRLNKEMMQLYKRERANPLAGCLPILVQIPVFFALYSVLFVTIEMRHAPFFWWIEDLAAPDPSALITAFGYFDWGAPSFLMIGVWPIAFGVTMWLQMKLNPQPIDPMQQKIMMALPFVFLFLFGQFPAGLVVYWTWNNVLSIGQQWLIMRRMGVTKEALNKEAKHLKMLKEGTGKERERAIAALDAKLAKDKKASEKNASLSGKKSIMDRLLQTGEEAREQASKRRESRDEKLADRKREFQRRADARRRGKKPINRKKAKAPIKQESSEPRVSRKQRRAEKVARAAETAVKTNLDSLSKKDVTAKDKGNQDPKWPDEKPQNRSRKPRKKTRKKR